MSDHQISITTLPLGAFNGATELPLAKVPDGYGGITVVEANLSGAAGTVIGAKLVTLTDAGTPVLNGTIGAFAGTVTTAAGVVFEATLTTRTSAINGNYVAEGYWIGFDATSGTVPAGSFVTLAYLQGKG